MSRYAALPVLHTVELLDWATGGPMPACLHGKQIPECTAPVDTKSEAGAQESLAAGSRNDIGVW
jgi:hypothetical protein